MTGNTAAFLRAYRETLNISRASEAAGISRDLHHRRMNPKHPSYDPAYVEAFRIAQEEAITVLEDAAVERATVGVERTKYFKGVPCGTEIEYSDSLLQFLLRGARPEKYRERHQVEHTGSISIVERLQAGRKRIAKISDPDDGSNT